MKHLLVATTLMVCALHLRGMDSLPPLPEGKVPMTLDALWGNYDPRKEPLAVEVLKAWEQDGAVCQLIRYQVGTFKGAPAKVAAFFAYPKGGTQLPAILEMHGGGQSASLDSVVSFARRGYAALSLNWGGNKLNFGRSKETYDGPQTDWGLLDATHPPQRNKVNHFAGPLTPDDFTLDPVESPRNSNWFLVLIAARRGLAFLEQQPCVDGKRLGACGHSMGGKLTTNLAGIDHRVRTAVPSCGGSGDISETQTDLPGCLKTKRSEVELACISDNAYIPRIACPTLWLSPANDFHAHIDNMAWNWRNVPDDLLRFSIAPHLNHRHTAEHGITQHLWFEQHLKNAYVMPATPEIALNLATADGVPAVSVTPDPKFPLRRVDIYYSIDPHALTRFWRDAQAKPSGNRWIAVCPVMSVEEPLFVYANVIYDTPPQYRDLPLASGQENSDTFAISSRVLSKSGTQLRSAGTKATDKPERMIDDGARGWRDWYQLNWGHPPLWNASTRKLKDPKWRGPDDARLFFEIRSVTENQLVLKFTCNEWGAFEPGKPARDFTAVKELKASPEWQTVSVSLDELACTDPAITGKLTNWATVAQFSISPSGQTVKDGQKVNVAGKAWQGPRELRNLRWEGGTYPAKATAVAPLSPAEHQKNFNEAIRKSIEQEKQDARRL